MTKTKNVFFTRTKTQHPDNISKRNINFLPDGDIPEKVQKREINMLYMNIDFPRKSTYIKEIKYKLYSYKKQDDKMQRDTTDLSNNNVFYESILQKLVESTLTCCYCLQDVVVLYSNTYQKNQWTLDRKNNDENHHYDNCVISCLECNIRKRRRSDKDFRFTKQMNIQKLS
jgi:hypothetical protein